MYYIHTVHMLFENSFKFVITTVYMHGSCMHGSVHASAWLYCICICSKIMQGTCMMHMLLLACKKLARIMSVFFDWVANLHKNGLGFYNLHKNRLGFYNLHKNGLGF